MTESETATAISDLSEDCLTAILPKTSPRDACRTAAISKGFKSAADSDAVWDRFLPPDYRQIIATAVSPVVFDSKKLLYHRLSESYILLDDGNLGFKLDKESGRKCYMLGARGLSIAWGDDTRYWEWGRVPESRFAEVGILRQVWWLDIHAQIATVMLSPKTTYVAYLVYRVTMDSWGLSTAGNTVVSFGAIRNETPNVYLEESRAEEVIGARAPTLRNDGWMEIELGEFYCDDGDEGEVEMRFLEHDAYKGGLILEGIELRPR